MPRDLFDDVDQLAGRILSAGHVILFVDFDGTLAGTAAEPALAGLSPHMDRVLRALAGRDNLSLAVMSGRDRADLQSRVNIPGAIYAGNHGLEINGHGFIFVEPTAAGCAEAIKSVTVELNRRLQPIEGALVEDKGLTIAVHYRLVEGRGDEVRRIVHAVLAASNHPFQLVNGDKAYEIRPRVYWNKGTAVEWIKQQLDKPFALPIYVGGDPTDEEAYAVLAEDGITVRVGATQETAAAYQLEGPAGVRKFLEWLDGLLGSRYPAVTAANAVRAR